MYRLHVFIIALAAASIVGGVASQTSQPTHIHESAPTSMINGATNPELISDLTAYRLWLVTVSRPSVPTDAQKHSQHLQLMKLGMQDNEERLLVAVLADFKAQYQTLIQNYNAEATAQLARGEKPDIAAIRFQRDLIVQSTHDRIKAVLSSERWSQLDAHVHNEKAKMRITQQGGIQ